MKNKDLTYYPKSKKNMKDTGIKEHESADFIRFLISIIILFLVICATSGCTSNKKIIYIHDTIDNSTTYTQYQYIKDSIYIDKWHTVYQKGDTIYKTDSIVKYKWYISNDTIRDTIISKSVIEKPVEVVKVEKERVRGFFWYLGLFGLLGSIGYIGYKVYRLIKK